MKKEKYAIFQILNEEKFNKMSNTKDYSLKEQFFYYLNIQI